MEKTAVEWLVEQIKQNVHNSFEEFESLFEQAKEMEKQNLYNFYMQGGVDAIFQSDRTVEDYYNETFKTK